MSQSLHLTEWEPFVISRATKAESYQKRWTRFLQNSRIDEEKLYLPLVMAAISHWSKPRIYLALDTTVLWNRYCMIHISLASWLLRHHHDVMLLADRGFAHQKLLEWLNQRTWHYCLRIPSDTLVHGVHRWRACPVSQLRTVKGEAKMYHQVRLWESATERVNLANAYPVGVAEPWTVITDEVPTLQTFRQYVLRFRVEELFLYLVVAIAILYGTVMGTTVQLSGLRTQVDVHLRRGLSYLKIGLRWLRGAIYKNRKLLSLLPLPNRELERCFASHRAEADYYERLLFSRIRSLHCPV